MSKSAWRKRDIALQCLPFALLFAFMLLWHATLDPTFGDDAWFRDILPGQRLIDYLVFRYNNWTSRVILEVFAVTVTHSVLLWKILDSVVLTAIPLLMLALLDAKKNQAVAWGLCACAFVYPLNILCTAGWITTTVFYSWPFMFGLVAMLPFGWAWRGKRFSWLWALPCVPSLLIACNNEQICLLLLGVSLVVCALVCAERHRIPGLLIAEAMLMVASMVVVFTCLGNWNRVIQETSNWFPTFGELSVFTKFEMGFSSTGYLLVMKKNWLYALFCALLAMAVWRSRKHPLERVIVLVPLVFCLIYGFFPGFFKGIVPGLVKLRKRLKDTGTGFQFSDPHTWIPDMLLLGVFACVLYSLIVSFGDSKTRIFAAALLIFGLGTRVMVGFSPTIWVSGERTACFLYYSLVMLSGMLIQRMIPKEGGRMAQILSGAFALCFLIAAIPYIAPLFKR